MSWIGRGTFVIILIAVIAYLWRDPFYPESIKGKRVVITGCSTGIGEQLAYHYSRLGAKILITARRGNVLEKVVQKCKELGAQEAYYIPLDMSIFEDTIALIVEAKAKMGGMDHLIINHIVSTSLEFWEGDFKHYQLMSDVNLKAYVSLATHALPMLQESKGSIGVVSSLAGKVGVPFSAVYCANKFALGGFFSAYRQELRLKNIDVSISEFVIGSINTPNAIKNSQHVFDPRIFATSAEDTAYRIMSGTQQRERTVYFPLHIYPLVLLRDYIPELIDFAVTSLVKESAISGQNDKS